MARRLLPSRNSRRLVHVLTNPILSNQFLTLLSFPYCYNMTSFSFLVTTDNHVGYKSDDHIRHEDSFAAFAEALQTAREKDVDFILLGGDLFHVSRPSNMVEHKCIKIIRQHMVAQTQQTTFKRISGKLSHFENLDHANFEDPNLTVSYPIFTIHGNHDDPTGPDAKSICEKLATCGLINYFGLFRPSEDKTIFIEPIVIQKGEVKIALYGLGFIPDLKLRQAFKNGKVNFQRPPEDTYNILIVHQNRVKHVESKWIPDEIFPKFFHLIIRGHEHTAQSPEKIPDSKVNGLVYQPGSTVATSVSVMEAGPKFVSVMSVTIKDPRADPSNRFNLDYELLPIRSLRPMILKDVSQKEVFKYVKAKDPRKQLTPYAYKLLFRDCVIGKIKDLLRDFNEKNNSEKLPLVRLRLEYSKKAERFSEDEVECIFYPSQVANRDIILFKKQKIVQDESGKPENVTFADDDVDDLDDEDEVEVIDLSQERKDTIDTMIESYFIGKPNAERLVALSIEEYTNAIRGAAEDGNVISKVLSKKREQIEKLYEKSIGNEEEAERDFHDEQKVRDWFMRALSSTEAPKKFAGDEYEVAMQEVEAMRDDSDIEWED